MKDLDESKVYDLNDLTEKQLLQVKLYLNLIDKGWRYVPIKEFKERISDNLLFFDNIGEEWLFVQKKGNYAKGLELFENKVSDVENMEIEKPKHYQKGIDTFTRMEVNCTKEECFNPQKHYDNSKGSLYKLASELDLNHWEFDILKRLVRCRKKNQFREDLEKIKDTINIYLTEFE